LRLATCAEKSSRATRSSARRCRLRRDGSSGGIQWNRIHSFVFVLIVLVPSLNCPGAVWCARLNAPATQAATAAADFSAKLWDALSGAELHTLQHKHIVKSVCFSADSTRLYTGGAEKKLRIFDLARPDADAALLEDHKSSISNVLTARDDNLIITVAAEKDVRIWDRRTNAVAQRLPTTGDIRYAQTNLDGSVLCVSTGGKEVSFYNTANMQLIKTFTMPREVDCLSYDAAHDRFVTVRTPNTNASMSLCALSRGSRNLRLTIHILTAHQCVHVCVCRVRRRSCGFAATISRAERRLVSGHICRPSVAAYWRHSLVSPVCSHPSRRRACPLSAACNKGHHGPVRSLAFTPSGNNYASGSEDGTIRIWSWAGLEEALANVRLNKDDKERAVEKN
jgi:WD40 repeat protein